MRTLHRNVNKNSRTKRVELEHETTERGCELVIGSEGRDKV